jgi:hypothetical protein
MGTGRAVLRKRQHPSLSLVLASSLLVLASIVAYSFVTTTEAAAHELTVNEFGEIELPSCPNDEMIIWDATFDDEAVGFPTEADAITNAIESDTLIPELAALRDGSDDQLETTHVEVDPELIGTGEAYVVTAAAGAGFLQSDAPPGAGLLVDRVGVNQGWNVVGAAFCTSEIASALAILESEQP